MKVICIDGVPTNPNAPYLPEGTPLEATQSDVYADCYYIKGYEFGKNGNPMSHGKRRFLMLSDMDETELVNEKQLQSCGG